MNLSDCHLVAGGELKAVHTAETIVDVLARSPVPSDPDFDEVHMGTEPPRADRGLPGRYQASGLGEAERGRRPV